MDTPLPDTAAQLREEVAKLQEAILTLHPTLPILLRTIHKQLLADPQIVTLLSDEEIGIIVTGAKRHTSTEIAAKIVKESSGAKGKAKLASTTTADL